MSTNAVTIRTTSLPMLVGTLLRHLTEGRGRHRASDDAGERDDRERVRNHLDELRWNDLRALQLNLHCLRAREEETGEPRARRIPPSENRRGQGDESASGGHLGAELMLVERKVGAAQRGQRSGEGHGK